MGKNKHQALRSCSQSSESDEPPSKQGKVWQYGDVHALYNPSVEPDDTYNRQWTVVNKGDKTENITEQLEKDVGTILRLDCHPIHIHSSFKEALKSILEDIEAAESSVIVVHGVPSIGKSTLAKTLAYYLAMKEGQATYRQLGHCNFDKDDVTGSVIRLISDKKYVVIDQCNLNWIHAHEILYSSIRHKDQYHAPVILFTSGSYALPKEWTAMSPKKVKFKVIDMKVDAKTITDIITTELKIDENQISEDLVAEILAVTTNMGRIRKLLTKIDKEDNRVDRTSIIEHVYSMDDMLALSKNVGYGVWLTWERDMQRKGLKGEDGARLSMEYVAAFDKIESDEKGKRSDYGVINMLDIVAKMPEVCDERPQFQNARVSTEMASNKKGDCEKEKTKENAGYCEYQIDSYEYILLHPKYVENVLRSCNANRVPKVKIIRQSYDYFTKFSFSRHQFVRDRLFKYLVEVYCTHPYGLCASFVSRCCDRKRVTRHVHVCTLKSLCQLPSSVKDSGLSQEPFWCFWCVLNLEKSALQGFDFAHFRLEKSERGEVEIRELQLFNATVKPEDKDSVKKGKMVKCLDSIRVGLKKEGYLKESHYGRVVPFYLCPVGMRGNITLPNQEKATVCWVDTTLIGSASENS